MTPIIGNNYEFNSLATNHPWGLNKTVLVSYKTIEETKGFTVFTGTYRRYT